MSEKIVEEVEVDDVDATEVETEDTEDESDDGEETLESVKAKLAKAEALIIKNKKATKQTIKKPDSTETDEIPDWGKKILSTEEKRTFGYDRKLSPETVDAVFQFTGGKQPTDEDMEHPAVKAIVSSLEAAKRVQANTPKGGSKPVYKGKTYGEIATDKDATPADKQKAFEAAAKAHGVS